MNDLSKKFPDSFVFSDDGYKTTAVLNFYLDQQIYAGNIIGKHALQYSVVDADLSSLVGKNALYIDSDRRFNNLDKSAKVPELLNQYFDKIVELEPIVIRNKKGEALRKFFVYQCQDYALDPK